MHPRKTTTGESVLNFVYRGASLISPLKPVPSLSQHGDNTRLHCLQQFQANNELQLQSAMELVMHNGSDLNNDGNESDEDNLKSSDDFVPVSDEFDKDNSSDRDNDCFRVNIARFPSLCGQLFQDLPHHGQLPLCKPSEE